MIGLIVRFILTVRNDCNFTTTQQLFSRLRLLALFLLDRHTNYEKVTVHLTLFVPSRKQGIICPVYQMVSCLVPALITYGTRVLYQRPACS